MVRVGKGVGDLWHQVGIAANHRYLDALAAAPLKGEGVAALDALCRPRTKRGRTYALSPTLFRAAMAGEHAIRGFRTPTSRPASTADHRPTVTKPTDGARRSHGRSSSSGVTASWRSSLVPAATASPATAIA